MSPPNDRPTVPLLAEERQKQQEEEKAAKEAAAAEEARRARLAALMFFHQRLSPEQSFALALSALPTPAPALASLTVKCFTSTRYDTLL